MSIAIFEGELTKLIDGEVDRLTRIVAAGLTAAVTDYATYRFYVGQIQALRRVVIDFIPDTNSKLNKA